MITVDKWTVHRATVENSVRKTTVSSVAHNFLKIKAKEYGIENYTKFIEEIDSNLERYDEITERERDYFDLAKSIASWAAISPCIKPYLAIREWLELGEDILDGLANAAMAENPHWFSSPEQEKKTSETPASYTTD